MTRKDYELIADTLVFTGSELDQAVHDRIVERFAATLRLENNRFNPFVFAKRAKHSNPAGVEATIGF